MEFGEDEALHQHHKRSKSIKYSQLPSTSVQDSSILPPELITDILSRLPVKSLLQCRCVSKSWLSLICSPEFIKTHLSLAANNKGLSLLDESVVDSSDMNYPVENHCGRFWTVGSVNGLICVSGFSSSMVTYGFGYDEIHDEYKVLRVRSTCQHHNKHHNEFEVYSLKTDSWRSIHCLKNELLFTEVGKFVNGKLHWATCDGHLHEGWIISSIDLSCEEWGVVELPCYGEGNGVFSLGVYGSNLSMVCTDPRTHVDVWVMKEYGIKKSWTKMFTIKYPPYEHRLGYLFSPSFCLSNTGEILVIFGSVFMIYNPKDDSTRYPKSVDVGDGNFGVEAEIYFESLVCPLLQNELRTRQG
ncbi:F-box/kelch-repeat protein At3g23880-like [Solanum stenotomum]|uniref:F-box/kelch-repeat protein At3g23880-like n=1 Tax=Solanum stenotomum TaxID=172797 RepID=UPI0020D1A42D|nr:F-box/kelch-repeat protein At3g23880-like [Solanum stenotomum]